MVADGLTDAGVNVFIIDYQVCPVVTIDEITRQRRAAVAHIYRNAEQFEVDPNRIHVTGNSAGGHLTAMVALTDWVGNYGLPWDTIKSGYPISGLYDLEPFRDLVAAQDSIHRGRNPQKQPNVLGARKPTASVCQLGCRRKP